MRSSIEGAILESYYNFVSRKLYRRISLENLYNLLREAIRPLEKIQVDVRESTGYILAEDVVSPVDRPHLDISHVDGFAVRCEDVAEASESNPVKLRIVEGVDSRRAEEYELKRGEAVLVETGYPLPRGADAVVPVEMTRLEDNYVIISARIPCGFHVFHKASDLQKGEVIARKGERITPMIMKTLMDLGIEKVLVYRRPRVALLNIGSEVVDEPVPPGKGLVPASTKYLMNALITHYGGKIVHEEIIPDDPSEIVRRIREVLPSVDMVVTIGGVSMGPKDYTWISLYEYFKPEYYWRGTKIHPARSLSGMVVNGKPVINQPGLPQSSLSAAVFAILPLLNHLQGRGLRLELPYTVGESTEEYVFHKFIDHYRIRYANILNSKINVIMTVESYDLSPILKSNGFIIIPPMKDKIEKNEKLIVYHLPGVHNPPIEQLPLP